MRQPLFLWNKLYYFTSKVIFTFTLKALTFPFLTTTLWLCTYADFTLSTGTLAAGEVIVIGTSDMQTVTENNGSVFHLKAFIFN
jgi:hypothetical protein